MQILVPETAFLSVSTKNTDSGHSQSRKFPNHGLPAVLRILRNLKQTVTTLYHYRDCAHFWLWSESVFLALMQSKADSRYENEPHTHTHTHTHTCVRVCSSRDRGERWFHVQDVQPLLGRLASHSWDFKIYNAVVNENATKQQYHW